MKIPYENEYKQLGLNIAYYRKKQGLTQENLAEMIDVSRTHMSRIETSYKSTVSLDVVFAIAKALDIDVIKLFEKR
ncbi:helix-turn-helix transcriptional regulator [Chakrabartyella piscis]|uniref:helix-turn-helix domain-containing protein n=1 Tax=Chakrabartyella piscis TaxID=2918914 RepID=UPI002958D3A9|nr:helix-turn-helix transcriptional regulator [Chakrabartyella piscis]